MNLISIFKQSLKEEKKLNKKYLFEKIFMYYDKPGKLQSDDKWVRNSSDADGKYYADHFEVEETQGVPEIVFYRGVAGIKSKGMEVARVRYNKDKKKFIEYDDSKYWDDIDDKANAYYEIIPLSGPTNILFIRLKNNDIEGLKK